MGELPDGFSTRTGQGRWSDQHTGFNWCICIWAYANFITQHDADELPIQCDAIPEQVRARLSFSNALLRRRLGSAPVELCGWNPRIMVIIQWNWFYCEVFPGAECVLSPRETRRSLPSLPATKPSRCCPC